MNSFSRGFAYECCFPRAEKWAAMNVCSYPMPQKVFDAFCVKSLPLESQIGQWKKEIAEDVHSTWVYKETSNGKADATCLNNLSAIYTAKNIQVAVEEELRWFSQPYSKPETVVQHPPSSNIQEFQEFLYCNRYDTIVQPQDMSANELAMICVNRWVSSDHVCWLMKTE